MFLLVLLCKICKVPIEHPYDQYPFLELMGVFSSIIVVYAFPDLDYCTLSALVFTWGLLGLSWIDALHFILPDQLIFSLWVIGLIVNGLFEIFTSSVSVFLGSSLGYFSLLLLSKTYYSLTGRIGLGQGDVKLFGLLGAWLGVQALPLILWISSSSGLLFALWNLAYKRQDYSEPIPFGPFLALGGWVHLLFY